VVERLPGYAHDLNPIEMVWGNVKGGRVGQLVPGHHR
jgi:transposase